MAKVTGGFGKKIVINIDKFAIALDKDNVCHRSRSVTNVLSITYVTDPDKIYYNS